MSEVADIGDAIDAVMTASDNVRLMQESLTSMQYTLAGLTCIFAGFCVISIVLHLRLIHDIGESKLPGRYYYGETGEDCPLNTGSYPDQELHGLWGKFKAEYFLPNRFLRHRAKVRNRGANPF